MAWHEWLLRSAAGAPANMQIMYGINGQRRLLEWEAGWLPGYEGAKPVRVGNAAHAQLQLDVYGELMDVFHQCRVAKLELNGGTWALERACSSIWPSIWDRPDRGIWERRGDGRHYVSSKVMSWVAFDRGIKSAEKFGFKAPLENGGRCATPSTAMSARRALTREELRRILRLKMLDASILLLPSVGSSSRPIPACAARSQAIEKHLMRDGFVLRHDPREVASSSHRGRLPRLHPLACGCLCAGRRVRQAQHCSTVWSRSPTISGSSPRNTIPAQAARPEISRRR